MFHWTGESSRPVRSKVRVRCIFVAANLEGHDSALSDGAVDGMRARGEKGAVFGAEHPGVRLGGFFRQTPGDHKGLPGLPVGDVAAGEIGLDLAIGAADDEGGKARGAGGPAADVDEGADSATGAVAIGDVTVAGALEGAADLLHQG